MPCPDMERLEKFAREGTGDAGVRDHLDSCTACLGVLVEIKRNLALVDRVAGADRFFDDETIVPAASGTSHTGLDLPKLAIPGYEFLDELSRGGQGLVYKARQESTRRIVAVKVLRAGYFADAREKMRFEREVHILGRLKHPNIVTIYDSGQVDGRPFFVMDYINGSALDEHVAAFAGAPPTTMTGSTPSRRPFAHTLELFAGICDAVHAAHLRGIIHRDLKPSNIRVDEEGQPHILDFGLAKLTAEEGEPAMTLAGQFLGSLPWSSPEQAESNPDKIDVRTDIYSLGVVLYQLVTGRFPYDVTGHMRDVLERIAKQDPVRPSSVCKEIDAELETILLKCLSKEPERRYQSAGDLARDVNLYLSGEAIEAKRDSGMYLLRKTLRRYRVPVAVAGMFVLVLCAATVVSGWFAFRQQRIAQEMRLSSNTLRVLLQTRGDLNRALPAFRDAVGRANGEFGPRHPFVATAKFNCASVLLALEEYEEAESMFRESLEIRRSKHGDRHPQVGESLSALGSLAAETGDHEKAVRLFKEALAIPMPPDPESKLHAVSCHLKLGLSHLALREFDQARDALMLAYRHFEAERMPIDIEWKIVNSLVRLYRGWHAADPTGGYDKLRTEWNDKLKELPEPTGREGRPPPPPMDFDRPPPRRDRPPPR